MLIIFDVDGTLIGGESVDWKCFDEAFRHVTGAPFPADFFSTIPEITARAIVHQALPGSDAADRARIEQLVGCEYLARLRDAHASDPACFSPAPGAIDLLAHLDQRDDLGVAIATGDWLDTISFKMAAAGIDASRHPMATSSDCYARADIIRLAAERAGRPLDEVVYVGDGPWDFHATRQLGIPFLGVGHRCPQLRDLGATHTLQTLEPAAFAAWLDRFLGTRPR